jgi:uncharacterized membrane protein YfcA
MWQYIITFAAVFATDILYVYFIKSLQNDQPFQASIWSAVVTFTASVAVINYTENHYTLIASLLGAFAGTYVGMRYRHKLLGD